MTLIKHLKETYGYDGEYLSIVFDKFRSLLYEKYKDNKDFLMHLGNHWVFD